MMLATLGAYVQGIIDAFKIRVSVAYGIFEAESCLKTQLDEVNDIGLLQDATIVITPNGYNENILHTVKGNTITSPPYNLSQYTETSTLWQGGQAVVGVVTTQLNPFGVMSAVRIQEAASTNVHLASNNIGALIVLGRTYTFSVYFKKGDGATAPDIIQLTVIAGIGTAYANFDINTGVVTLASGCTSTITSAPNGWWRCSITATATSTSAVSGLRIYFCNNNPLSALAPSYLGAVSSNVFFIGTQIEESPIMTTYQPILFTQILEQGYAQHARSTTGYRVESTGLVREVPQENLIAASENMLLSNVTKSLLTIIPNTEPSPIANTIPMLLNDGTGVGRRRVANTTPPLISIGDEFMLSIYAKKAQHDWIQVNPVNANYNIDDWANFNLDTGTIGNKGATGTAYIESIGNGWYRCSVLCRAVGNITQQIDVCQSIGNVNGGRYPNLSGTNQNVFYICGNTFTRGNTVKPYYPTTLRTNTPRLDYTDGSCPTILLEQSSTNLLPRSEEFNDGGWLKTNLTVTPNTDTAPNGLLTADTLLATDNGAVIKQNSIFVNVTPRMFSIYLKRKTGTGNITLEIGSVSTLATINSLTYTRVNVLGITLASTFSISAGLHTITTPIPHGYETGDGIRFTLLTTTSGSGAASVTTTATVTGPNTFTFTSGTATATGTCNIVTFMCRVRMQTLGDEIYAWGAQCELSSTTLQNGYYEPTSYIPTPASSTVTREADVLHLSKIQENNLLNNTYTLFWEARKIGGGTTNDCYIGLIENYNTVNPNAIFIAGFPIYGRKLDNNVGTTFFPTTIYQPSSQNYHKGIITCNNGIFEIWIDGSKLSTTSLVNYQALKLLILRGAANGITRFKQVLGWNRVLNRTEIDLLFAYPYYNTGYTPTNNELHQIINRAYAEGFTLPSTTILGHCDTLITEMKNDGVWNVSDVYYNFAYNDVALSDWSRINWMNPYGGLGVATLFGDITYQANGFKGDASFGYIDTLFNPSIATYNYTLNNACRFMIVAESPTLGSNGLDNATGVSNQMLAQAALQQRINSGAGTAAVSFNFTGTGLKSICRDNSTDIRLQSQSTLLSTTQTSTALINATQKLFVTNSTGSNACAASYFMGASLSNSQIANFRTYYNTFLTNVGLTPFA